MNPPDLVRGSSATLAGAVLPVTYGARCEEARSLLPLVFMLWLLASIARGEDWVPTGPLNEERINHASCLLLDGRALVTAGYNGKTGDLSSCELYDPVRGTWRRTGSLAVARRFHSATLLQDGTVLVAGGTVSPDGALDSCELFDPESGTWVPVGPLSTPREAHTATRLLDGKVLVTGGRRNFIPGDGETDCELYDPATKSWRVAASMSWLRADHAATLLADGRVFVVGGAGVDGAGLASCEIYDPTSDRWTEAPPASAPRWYSTATLLRDGNVLVVGGTYLDADWSFYSSCELFDPVEGSWRATGSLAAAHSDHTASLLEDGSVLVTGGYNVEDDVLATCEQYDPLKGSWSAAASLHQRRSDHEAVVLGDGSVLVCGGYFDPQHGNQYPTTCEIHRDRPPSFFRRGDANADSTVDLTDVVFLLNHLFQGGPAPVCPDAADADDTEGLDLGDPIFLLNHLFRGGPRPPAPGSADCGIDPTPDALAECGASPDVCA